MMQEEMKIHDDQMEGAISIRAKDFLVVHDYFAEVLNIAQRLSDMSDKVGSEHLSREECAGRILMVTMLQMEKIREENPDLIEELMVAAKMAETENKRHIDAMYG